jgi:hypothetical protein
MTTTQAHQFGILDAQDGQMCIPENYSCNHWNRLAYCEGYIWIDPTNWTARTILGIDEDDEYEPEEIPGVSEAAPCN